MRLVIEGPDNLGKTTLAQKLAEEYRLDIYHAGAPTSADPLREQFLAAREEIDMVRRRWSVVFDRSCIGELVYGPLFRHYFPGPEYAQLVREFVGHVPVILLMGDHTSMQKTGLLPKSDETKAYQKAEQCLEISRAFATILTLANPVRVLMADLRHFPSLDQRNDYILQEVERWL